MQTRIVFFISIFLLSMSTKATPIFINNSFEQGFDGWTLDFADRVYRFSPDIQSFGFDGDQAMGGAVIQNERSFPVGPFRIKEREYFRQVVSGFEVGQTYTLSFYQQNNGKFLTPYDDGRASWEVLLNGNSEFFSDLMDVGQSVWQQQSFEFTATTSSIDFAFSPFDFDDAALLPGDTGVYPIIDLITLRVGGIEVAPEPPVNDIPEPVPAALLGAGLLLMAGIGGRASRKSKNTGSDI